MTLKDKQLKVLNDTIKAYNVNTLCIHETGGCKYYIEGKQGCAVGRLIDDIELRKKLDRNHEGGETDVSSVFELLPDNVKELGVEFLTDLQALHDTKALWDDKGLNVHGKDRVGQIKRNHNLNPPIFWESC